MTEPDPTINLVSALWHSNFKRLEISENGNVFVIAPRFTENALMLLYDLARSYDRNLIIYPTNVTHELGYVRAILINKEVYDAA